MSWGTGVFDSQLCSRSHLSRLQNLMSQWTHVSQMFQMKLGSEVCCGYSIIFDYYVLEFTQILVVNCFLIYCEMNLGHLQLQLCLKTG